MNFNISKNGKDKNIMSVNENYIYTKHFINPIGYVASRYRGVPQLIVFHFDYEIDFEIIDPNMIKTKLIGEKNINMLFDNFANMKLLKYDSWISKKYGHKMGSKSLEIQLSQVNFPLRYKTKIEVDI